MATSELLITAIRATGTFFILLSITFSHLHSGQLAFESVSGFSERCPSVKSSEHVECVPSPGFAYWNDGQFTSYLFDSGLMKIFQATASPPELQVMLSTPSVIERISFPFVWLIVSGLLLILFSIGVVEGVCSYLQPTDRDLEVTSPLRRRWISIFGKLSDLCEVWGIREVDWWPLVSQYEIAEFKKPNSMKKWICVSRPRDCNLQIDCY